MEIIIASNRQLQKYGSALKKGMELSSGARSTSTYYHSREEQMAAIQSEVQRLYSVDKSIPLLLASLTDSTEYFRQEVIINELKQGSDGGSQSIVAPSIWYDDNLQDHIINHVINSLPFTYALRLFMKLKDRRVNNNRTREKILRWVLANLNDFTAMKYRTKIREALIHVYGRKRYTWIINQLDLYLSNLGYRTNVLHNRVFKYSRLSGEEVAKLLLFVDRKGKASWYDGMTYTRAFFRAVNAGTEDTFFSAASQLDESVVMGIINGPNPLFQNFFKDGKLKDSFSKRLLTENRVASDDRKVRTKARRERKGVEAPLNVDYSKVGTETLYKTEGVDRQRTIRAAESRIDLPYTNIGIIVDRSLSNRGGKDSANTPAAIIDHLRDVLVASVDNTSVAETGLNQTDLSKPLVELAETNPNMEAVFVLSDGYENYPYEGCFNDLAKKAEITAIHISPYVSAEMKAQARTLGDWVVSMAVNKPSQITTQMEARLLDFNPRQYFENQFRRFLPGRVMSKTV